MQRVLIPHCISGSILPDGQVHDISGLTMGTTWSVKLVADAGMSTPVLHAGMQQVLDKIVDEMSHWQDDSSLCRFNRAAAGSWHALPDDFLTVLSYALSVAADSDGAYDPAAGALVNLWGFGAVDRHDEPGFAAPAGDAIAAILGMPGWRQIEMDTAGRRVRQPGSALLDFSSVAKGYAVDLLARHLEGQGILHYLVEVGGELRGAGMKPDGQPWWVTLEQPPDVGNGSAAAAKYAGEVLLALHGLSVATSGDYRRYFAADGKLYPHTLDPRTGHPVRNGIASVTVVHESCMAADALSTALTVLGVEKGMCFAEARCLAVRFLIRHHQGDGFVEYASSGFQEMLQ